MPDAGNEPFSWAPTSTFISIFFTKYNNYQKEGAMTIKVIVKAEVKDFEEWKVMFDNLEQQRQQMGINFKAYKNQEHPTYTYVIGTAPSESTFRDFFNSPERQEIQKFVMVSPPEITFLTEC